MPTACILAAWLAAASPAQHASGDVTVAILKDLAAGSGGGLRRIDRVGGNLVTLVNQPASVAELTSLFPSPFAMDLYYGGTDGRLNLAQPGQCHLLEIRAAFNAVSGVRQLTAASVNEGFIAAVCVVGEHVYAMGQRSLFRVPIQGGAAQSFLTYNANQGAFGLTTDGRWLYAALNARDVFRINLRNLADVRFLGRVPGQFLDVLTALALSADGTILAGTSDPILGARLHEMHPASGTVLRSLSLPLAALHDIACDPRTGEVLLAGTTASGATAVLSVPGWNVGPTLASAPSEIAIAIRRSWPLVRSELPCFTGDNREPGIDSITFPIRGNGHYEIQLFTRPNLLAFLLSSPRPTPQARVRINLAAQGAPGCVVGFQPLGLFLYQANAAGRADAPVPIPNDPLLRGVAMDFQWAIADPTANSLGFAVTQLGTILIE